MNLPLSEHWERFIRDRVESGRYASEVAMVEEALHLLALHDLGPPIRAENDEVRDAEPSPRKPIWEKILENAASIPAEEWDKVPTDGSEQHDHYIYGTPKRPTS
jgi:Arc/MetJ-type ribon-helix-helix transcriptional regulator